MIAIWRKPAFTTRCTIEIEHSAASLHAHVTLENDTPLGPGDKVTIHGAPVQIAFGEKLLLHRGATVQRASAIGRAFTKLQAQFELAALYEVSFSSCAPLGSRREQAFPFAR